MSIDDLVAAISMIHITMSLAVDIWRFQIASLYQCECVLLDAFMDRNNLKKKKMISNIIKNRC